MTDPQPPTPPPIPPPQPPLEYWHATGPRPLHPVLISLCIFAGVFLGSTLSFGFVSFASFGMFQSLKGWALPLLIGCVIILLGLGFTALSIRTIVRGSRLSIELRRRGPRYFVLGLLIGCGVACLLEGICFAGIGMASRS